MRVVLSMLATLPDAMAADYGSWIRIGFALHAFNGGKVGLALFKKFSARCTEKAAATDFEKVWAGFSRPYEGRAIGIGTLWKLQRITAGGLSTSPRSRSEGQKQQAQQRGGSRAGMTGSPFYTRNVRT